MKKSNHRLKAIFKLSGILATAAILTVIGCLVLNATVFDGAGTIEFIEFVHRHKFLGAVVLMLLNIMQVVVGFMPGELIEQAMGVFFGAVGGTIICVVSAAIGSVIAILLARRFGRTLVAELIGSDKMEQIELFGGKKRDLMLFMLYFVPGTPKDAFNYLVGLNDISIKRYLALTTFARLPAIVMSTISGDMIARMVEGEGERFGRIVVIWNIVCVAICVLGFAAYFVFLAVRRRRRKKETR